MKRLFLIALLGLCFFTGISQPDIKRQVFPLISKDRVTNTDFDSIAIDYDSVYWSNQNPTFTPSVSGSITWEWNLYNFKTKTLIQSLNTRIAEFDSLDIFGLYDVELIVNGSAYTYIEAAFYNHINKPSESDCDIVVDLATVSSGGAGSYFQNFSGADNAGLCICVKNSNVSNAGGGYFYPNNLRSSDPNNPVRIVKIGSTQSVIQNKVGSGSAHTWLMDNGANNIVIDGYLPNKRPGILIQSATGSQLVMIRNEYTGIHFTGVELNQTVGGSVGSCITLSPIATASINAEKFVGKNIVFFGNIILKANQEGFYLQHFEDRDTTSGYIFYKLDSLTIVNNYVNHTGRDGIQVCASTNIKMLRNTVLNFGELGETNHENCISYNPGNAGIVKGNYCIGTGKFLNIESGIWPCNIFTNGKNCAPLPTYIISNVFAQQTNSTPEPYAIYIQNFLNSTNRGPLNYYIIGNTVYTQIKFAEAYSHTNSFTINIFDENNLVVKIGTPYFGMAGPGTVANITTNDLIREQGNTSDIYFTDEVNNILTISSLLSEVYNGSTSNISGDIPVLTQYDISNYPMQVTGFGYTYGAYSGFQKR